MKIAAKWRVNCNGHQLICNGITLARIWPDGEKVKLHITLPGSGIRQNCFADIAEAVDMAEKTVNKWFDKIDA